MGDSTGPDPPDGYQESYEPPTALSWWEFLPGEIGLLGGAVGLFGGLTVLVHDATAVRAVFGRAATLDSRGAWGIYLALVATSA